MRFLRTAIVALLLASGAAHASTTNLLTNGSFETYTGSLNRAGWNLFSSAQVPGWTGTPNIELQSQRTLNFTPQDGLIYAELDTNQNSVLSQSLILNRGTYEFSFYYSPRVRRGPVDTNDMSFAISDGSGLLTGGSILSAPTAAYPWRQWTQVIASFFVQSDNTNVTLRFSALGTSAGDSCGRCGALIDNVSIAAVPLPAGGVLILSAIGGLWLTRRRKAI